MSRFLVCDEQGSSAEKTQEEMQGVEVPCSRLRGREMTALKVIQAGGVCVNGEVRLERWR